MTGRATGHGAARAARGGRGGTRARGGRPTHGPTPGITRARGNGRGCPAGTPGSTVKDGVDRRVNAYGSAVRRCAPSRRPVATRRGHKGVARRQRGIQSPTPPPDCLVPRGPARGLDSVGAVVTRTTARGTNAAARDRAAAVMAGGVGVPRGRRPPRRTGLMRRRAVVVAAVGHRGRR